MKTLNLTITLPDIVPFDDWDIIHMQVLFVKSLVDSGRIDFNDSAQRDAVLEWYQKVVPHMQSDGEENQRVEAALRHVVSWPELEDRSADELMAAIDAEMNRLKTENGWTAETFERWGQEHLRTSSKRP